MEREKIRQQLVDHYLDFYSLAYAMLGNDDDTRDAVQEALARTLSKPLVKDTVNYCYQTVRRTAIDILRHRKRLVPLSSDVADREHDIEAEREFSAMLEYAAQLRDELPETTRTLVVLHDEKGLTYQELARLTGISIMSIRRQIKKTHAQLRDKLTKKKGETT